MIRNICPILPVLDVTKTLDFYETQFGAKECWKWGDPVVHGGCQLGTASVQFGYDPEMYERVQKMYFFLSVVDVASFYERFKQKGLTIINELEYKPWGAHEFCVADCNNIWFRFTEFGFGNQRRKPEVEVVLIDRNPTKMELHELMKSVSWRTDSDPEIEDCVIEEPYFTVIAEHKGQVVGSASILGQASGNYLISNVVVHGEFQSSGIGKKLMSRLDAWLCESGVPGALVKLFTTGDRQNFYAQFGFRGPDTGLLGMSKRIGR